MTKWRSSKVTLYTRKKLQQKQQDDAETKELVERLNLLYRQQPTKED
ncbi:hypothetical protein G3R49_12275 [Shewanella sp. WXL01]|nr:hypothetical protein [Shewanella sp. WXL01]NKF51333.1 hypothetical protein [Shewanella sp. WXL01]